VHTSQAFNACEVCHGRLEGLPGIIRLAMLDDETAIVTIRSIKGMGRRTAEIYLLFALERMDAFPSRGIALAGTLADLKSLPARPSLVALCRIATGW
jgi:DNA-3-methyladenine glycosylase II